MTDPRTPTGGTTGRGIGWTLVISLIIAVSIAISMAVQLSPERAAPEPPNCGGLYDECCLEWDDDRDPCITFECPTPAPAREGLFDAEEHFANRQSDC